VNVRTSGEFADWTTRDWWRTAETRLESFYDYGKYDAEVRNLERRAHGQVIGSPGDLGLPVCKHNHTTVLAQVAYAVENECASTLADVLLRRVPAGWSACHALDGLERVAGVMAERLGWSPDRVAHEVRAYEREVGETLVPVDAVEA
jgi:glycerol-3-phosphate dehydrogenase